MQSAAAAFYLFGPTAVGKSGLAVEIAERCGGEIVGADAFQIYAGLDLLTAKPEPELRARVPHHLIGEVPLSQTYDVAQYLAAAHERIMEIRSRGKPVIVVGGTGLYIRALTRGLALVPPADLALRAQLTAEPLVDLQRRLRELDPACAAVIDLQNPRRVIRALEVCLLTGAPFSSLRTQWDAGSSSLAGVCATRERTDLYGRIDARTEAMFADGVVEEVRAAGEIGPTAGQAIGLREIRAWMAGEMTRAECIGAIQQATRQYAKRQLTWLRRETAFEVIDLSQPSSTEHLATALARRATETLAS